MVYIALGCLGFLFFYLFDMNKILFIHRWMNGLFAVGIIMLVYATFGLIRNSEAQFQLLMPLRLFFVAAAAVSIFMQFYALFFALPFSDTYWNDGKRKIVIHKGLYGLCRHPGVIFFFFFYMFLWLSTGIHFIFWAGIIWTAMDVLHVYVQDRWMFPLTLINYEEYRESTPFLLPSLDRLKSLHLKEEGKIL